jgi:hypothetical protein
MPHTLDAEMIEFLCNPVIVETIVDNTAAGKHYQQVRAAVSRYYEKNRDAILEKARLRRVEFRKTNPPKKGGRPRKSAAETPPQTEAL